MATHLTEIIKRYAAEILGRQEVQAILDTLKTDYPAVVDEVKKALGIGEIQKVLQGLLAERVSVRNMVAILETLADYGGVTKDIGFLIEKVRQSLGRQICLQYCDDKKVLQVLTIEPSLEKKIIDSRLETNRGIVSGLDPAMHRRWITTLVNSVRAVQEQGFHEVVLCSEAARPLVKVGHGTRDSAPGGHLEPRGGFGHHGGITRGDSAGGTVGSLETQRMPPRSA